MKCGRRAAWIPWELREYVELSDAPAEGVFWGEGLFQPAPELRDEHVRHYIVVSERNALLDRLPKHGVVSEVGTLSGEFSREILKRAQPRELHLIDHHIEPGVQVLANDVSSSGHVVVHESDSVEALASFPDQVLRLDLTLTRNTTTRV